MRHRLHSTHQTCVEETSVVVFFWVICCSIWRCCFIRVSLGIIGNTTDKMATGASVLLICFAFSYEERLKTMVLREEFFPLMEEVKHSVAVMIKGAKGNVLHTSTNNPNFDLSYATQCSFDVYIEVLVSMSFSSLPLELLACDDLHSVIRLVLKAGNYMNAVGIFLLRNMFF